jgi:hypothetical protein
LSDVFIGDRASSNIDIECAAAPLSLPMKITLQLPPDLERHLLDTATQCQLSPEYLILQALRQHLPVMPRSAGWSQIVLDYMGDPEFPAFECDRDVLLPPREPELF